MREIQYNKGVLLMQAAGPALVAALVMIGSGGQAFAPAAIVGGLCSVFAGFPIFKLLNGRPAIRFDDQTLELNTIKRSRSVTWTDVRSFDAIRTTTYAYGIIPLKSSTALQFQLAGGWLFGKTISLPMKQLDMTEADLPELMAEMARAKGRSYNLDAIAVASASGDAADADAVIARYMAQKQSTPRAPKTASASPAQLPLRGARAQFGRRPA